MEETMKRRRVTKGNVCPVCEHDSFCLVGDGDVFCMRVKSDKPITFRDGSIGWIHGSGTTMQQPAFVAPRTPRPTDTAMHNRWAPKARACFAGAETWKRVQDLAAQLGVAESALGELLVGWDGVTYTFPEKNAAGLIVGIHRRRTNGDKYHYGDSRRGLTYSETFADNPGPILVVEGASDVAAGITMGLAVVGRPSNTGGVPYLIRLLGPLTGRTIIVIAERDGKEGQCQDEWPGVVGAKSCRDRLRQRLGRVVRWCFMPGDWKDLRQWFAATKVPPTNRAACFKLGQSLIRRLT